MFFFVFPLQLIKYISQNLVTSALICRQLVVEKSACYLLIVIINLTIDL